MGRRGRTEAERRPRSRAPQSRVGLGTAELYQRDLVARGDEHGLHGHAGAHLLRRAVEHLTHEVDALVHEDVDHVVGQRRLEGGERGAADDGPGVDRAAAGGALPGELARQAAWAGGTRVVTEAAAGRAALEAELAAPGGGPELGVVVRRLEEREAHRRRMTAPVGSVLPPATRASSQPATCAVEVPRICRTASTVLLTPWMKASESWPPLVLQTSLPSGHASPPRSTNGPPSPGPQKP